MTRTEIKAKALSLPEEDRAALAGQLVASIEDPRRLEPVADQVNDAYQARLDAWGARLAAEMESWFDGEARELTPEVWEEILTKARTEENLDEPFGDSVPKEWTGRTRRELREFLAKQRS